MPYETEERLKSYLDANQQGREQLCLAVLQTDRFYSDIRPRQPKGGPDGNRDIQAIYNGEQIAFVAVGFVNGANDSRPQKTQIKNKFKSDFTDAKEEYKDLKVFVFFTNILFTTGEKEKLEEYAKDKGITHCDIYDRERIRIALDSLDGLAARYQYLGLKLSDAEQQAFFNRWGDDIQTMISNRFSDVDTKLNRILFLEESKTPLVYFSIGFELKRKYTAEEFGNYRVFCSLMMIEPKLEIAGFTFGSSDASLESKNSACLKKGGGIKNSINTWQWIETTNEENINLELERNGYGIGVAELGGLFITYKTGSFIRLRPTISMIDLNSATFVIFCNKKFAEKIKTIRFYSNDYFLHEIDDLKIDESEFDPDLPIRFVEEDLSDKWVRITRANDFGVAFHLDFFRFTPKRLYAPNVVYETKTERKK